MNIEAKVLNKILQIKSCNVLKHTHNMTTFGSS